MGFFAAIVVGTVGGAALLIGGPVAVTVGSALGFTGTGIGAGTLAASAQAYFGSVVTGSIITKLTSIAMLAPTP